MSGSPLSWALEGVLVRDLERQLACVRAVREAESDVCWADLERVMRTEVVVVTVAGVGEELEERTADSESSEISSSFLFGDEIALGSTGAFVPFLNPGFDGEV